MQCIRQILIQPTVLVMVKLIIIVVMLQQYITKYR